MDARMRIKKRTLINVNIPGIINNKRKLKLTTLKNIISTFKILSKINNKPINATESIHIKI